jgi:hypothetical protein
MNVTVPPGSFTAQDAPPSGASNPLLPPLTLPTLPVLPTLHQLLPPLDQLLP